MKKILIRILLIVLVFMFSGCGGYFIGYSNYQYPYYPYTYYRYPSYPYYGYYYSSHSRYDGYHYKHRVYHREDFHRSHRR